MDMIDALHAAFRACHYLDEYNTAAVCTIGNDGVIVEVNHKFEIISGYSKDELFNMHFTNLISVDAKVAYDWLLSGISGQIIHNQPVLIVNKRGKHVPIFHTRVPVIENGQVVGLFVIAKDVSRQKQFEDLLIKSQRLLESSQKLARLGTWEFDPESEQSFWSPELFQIFKIEDNREGQMELSSIIEYIHPDDKERFRHFTRFLSNGKPYNVEYRIVRQDGELRIIHSRSELYIDSNGRKRIIGTAQDITELRDAQARQLRVERVSSIEQLAAGIAHEIRNPLTSVKGFLKLIAVSEEPAPYLQIMESELIRIEKVINELLALGKSHCDPLSRFSIADTIDEAIQAVSMDAKTKRIEINLEIDHEGQPAYIAGDSNDVVQAFINVIKNALEATMEGGKIRIHIEREGPAHVRIDVNDTGCGMSEGFISKLGTPFYSTKEIGLGLGLGLLITQHVVSMLEGQINIKSKAGHGTTVSIILPCQ